MGFNKIVKQTERNLKGGIEMIGFFKFLIDPAVRGVISYGKQKKDGGHDHRYNRGDDRTPAQKAGDRKRRKKQIY